MTNQTPSQDPDESFTLPSEWLAVSAANNDCHDLIDQASAAIKRGETERAQKLLAGIGNRLDLAELEVRGLVEHFVNDRGERSYRQTEIAASLTIDQAPRLDRAKLEQSA